jgi:serine/threonine protein kinase
MTPSFDTPSETEIYHKLSPGTELGTLMARYILDLPIGKGQKRQAYRARVTEVYPQNSPPSNLVKDSTVLIKFPLVLKDRSFWSNQEVLNRINATILQEATINDRLEGKECTPMTIDVGVHTFQLDGDPTHSKFRAAFSVEEFVEGKKLDEWMRESFPTEPDIPNPSTTELSTRPSVDSEFHGIRNAQKYFEWAHKIAVGLLRIHQDQVVHGDIHPGNIMVRQKDQSVIFIDLGDATLRDQDVEGENTRRQPKTSWIPSEERGGTLQGDIYSLGGILLYLATGKSPAALRKIDAGEVLLGGIDETKARVRHIVKEQNPELYRSNAGIVDVIARCLRSDPHDRVRHVLDVLKDIEAFSSETDSIDLDTIAEVALPNNRLFRSIVQWHLREVRGIMAGIKRGVYEVTGSHDDLVSALVTQLGLLEEGDQYFTVSHPAFWRRDNAGVDGRVLTMNLLAAKRGATIRRVFMFTQEELERDQEVRAIVQAHLAMSEELRLEGRNVDDIEVSAGGCCTRFIVVTEEDRDKILESKRHFAASKHQSEEIIMVPVYGPRQQLAVVQFRAAMVGMFSELEDFVLKRMEQGQPLSAALEVG